jgi:hypothetical protein
LTIVNQTRDLKRVFNAVVLWHEVPNISYF